MEAPKRYKPALVTMLWLTALLGFINLFLGVVVFENGNRGPGAGPGAFQAMNPLVAVHTAVGITIIVLLIAQILLRVKTNEPLEATTGNRFLYTLAKFVHYRLYVAVLLVTVIGLIFSLQTG